jgi:hypothetical protein
MHAHRLLAGVLAPAAIAGALAVAAAAPEPAQAKAPALIHTYRVEKATCVIGPGHTSHARVTGWMRVVNYEGFGGDWADHMEAQARLEATGPGFSSHNWTKQKSGNLVINRTHRLPIRLTTEPFSSNFAWKVHVKLTWHRPWPTKNITKNVYLPFNGICGRAGGS